MNIEPLHYTQFNALSPEFNVYQSEIQFINQSIKGNEVYVYPFFFMCCIKKYIGGQRNTELSNILVY